MSHTDKSIEDITAALMRGYAEMSEINLEEAELCLGSDNEALSICEENLTECE